MKNKIWPLVIIFAFCFSSCVFGLTLEAETIKSPKLLLESKAKTKKYVEYLRIKLKETNDPAQQAKINKLIKQGETRLELLERVLGAKVESSPSPSPSPYFLWLRGGWGAGAFRLGFSGGRNFVKNLSFGLDGSYLIGSGFTAISYGALAAFTAQNNFHFTIGLNSVKYSVRTTDIPGIGERGADPKASVSFLIGKNFTLNKLPAVGKIGYDTALGYLAEVALLVSP